MKDLEERFAEMLGNAAQKRPVILIVDALNQINLTDRMFALSWLPARSVPIV